MKYLAQVRTKTFSDNWTNWTPVGDPMTEPEADDWIRLSERIKLNNVQYRVIVVPEDYPRVFVPKSV